MKWTEDNIQKYLLEHPNIKTRMQLKKANFNAYDSARRLNILDNLFGNPLHVKRWTKELIYELLKEHPEIKSRTDLRKVNGRAYLLQDN